MKRQAALQAHPAQGRATEETMINLEQVRGSLTCSIPQSDFFFKQDGNFPSLCQEANSVAELERTVQRGNSLLRRKEEQLLQLENSIAKEVRRSSACICALL